MTDTNDRELLELAAKNEEMARRAAYILGPSSAAQNALDEAERSRAAGVPAAVVLVGSTWVVVRAAASHCKGAIVNEELPTQKLREQVEELRLRLARMEDQLRRREDAEWRAWQLERSEALSQKISAAIRSRSPS